MDKREVPPSEMKIIRPLVEKMGDVWESTKPPSTGLAKFAVYGHSFMSLRKFSPFFPKVLSKKRLLDLGAGEPHEMTHFALRSGVSEYVAVDRYLDYSKRIPPFANVQYVNEDMLMFLAKQPDESANIVMLAIDHIVLSSSTTLTETLYKGMLLAEIKRVVPNGGIAFGYNCGILSGLTSMGFEKLRRIPGYRIPANYVEGGVFQKSE